MYANDTSQRDDTCGGSRNDRPLPFFRCRASALAQHLRGQLEEGHLRQIDLPLAVRAIASILLGLLVIQLLVTIAVTGSMQESEDDDA
jgi:hypothetical protein